MKNFINNKKPYNFLLIIFIQNFLSLSFFANNFTETINPFYQQNLPITHFTNHINKRYYFIARLEKTITLLNNIKQMEKKQTAFRQPLDIDPIINFENGPTFYHSHIKKSITLMQETKSLIPLFMVWEEFAAYKFLEDELFIEDFTKEIFVISKNLLTFISSGSLYKQHNLNFQTTVDMLYEQGLKAPITQLPDYIELFMKQFFALYHRQLAHLPIHDNNSIHRSIQLIQTVDTEEITMRFYVIQRIKKALDILVTTDQAIYPFFILDNTVVFKHEQIIECIDLMESLTTTQPLIKLWEDYKQFKYIDDQLFTKELLMVIFLVYKNIIDTHPMYYQKNKKKLDIIALYETISSLPIEELLTAIDIIIDAVEISGLKKPIGWQEWIVEYWWVRQLLLELLYILIC